MSRELSSAVGDLLYYDPCIRPLLDDEVDETHGTEAFCDQPTNSHPGRPVRREQMGWPSDFHRAVISFGQFQPLPAFGSAPPWVEQWTFVVNVFARERIILSDGTKAGNGDLWAMDIMRGVVRRLGWERAHDGIPCDADFRVMRRIHLGDSFPLDFNDAQRYWQIGTRFRWITVSRGLIPPICVPCR